MTTHVDVVSLVVLSSLVLAVAVSKWQSAPDDPISEARRAYVSGDISLDELERRLDLELDEEAQRIRAEVDPVNGVGPSKSAAIATRYGSLEALRAAPAEDLEAINGIGPSTSSAIKERVS